MKVELKNVSKRLNDVTVLEDIWLLTALCMKKCMRTLF